MTSFIRLANPPKCAANKPSMGGQHAFGNSRCIPRDTIRTACPQRRPNTPLDVDESVKLVDCVDVDAPKSPLSALHRRTIAIQIGVAGENRVLLGRGRFESDFTYGNVLKIKFPPDAGCEMMIVEDRWNGQILCGKSLGCDYLIRL